MTVNRQPVIAWTPYGRARTVSILERYMARDVDRGIIDGWWLAMNTDPDQADDIAYAHELAERYDWVALLDRPRDVPLLRPKQRNTGYFYRYFTDPDATYVRFDDDIVYIHEDATTNLVAAKQARTADLCCFPLIVNNAVCSYYLQRLGLIPEGWGEAGLYCMDRYGWGDGQFAVNLHTLLLEKIRAGQVPSLYSYQDIPLPPRTQFSVSAFACSGADYAALDPPGWLGYSEEESFHTVEWPQRLGRGNVLIGNAVVAHYTFGPQQKVVNATDILDQYREVADKI